MWLHVFKSPPLYLRLFAILLPWIVILGLVSKLVTLCTFLLFIMALAGLGLLVLKTISAPLSREDKIFLSLPMGFMVASCLVAIGVRLGVDPSALFWTVMAFAVFGLIQCFVRPEDVQGVPVPGLWGLCVLSLIIALVYFLPGALRDAVYLRDGSYNWMYVDTQYNCAMASSIKSSIGAPRLPDMGVVDLRYHFGPYALAGSMSAALGIPVGDAMVRVVRPAALLALLLATYSLGRFLGRDVGHETTGGILAVAGLFFYGSLASLFANNINSSSLISGAILFQLPYVEVEGNGGPFGHLLLGHSQVHGLSGFQCLLVVLLAKLRTREDRYLTADSFALGPAVLFPSSLLLGIASLGLTVVLLIWFGFRKRQTWFTVGIAACAAIFSVWAMGYVGSSMTAQTEFAPVRLTAERLFQFFVWFYIGLGIRLYAFARVKNPLRDPISAMLIISFAGFVCLSMFFHDHQWGNTRYGFVFAQDILSIFAFAWLSAPVHAILNKNWPEVYSTLTELIRVVLLSSILFLGCAALFSWLPSLSNKAGYPMRLALKSSFILVVSSFAVLVLMTKAKNLRSVITIIAFGICLVGFAAWVTDWVNFGLGRMRMDITISKGEAQGLETLQKASEKGDLIATNQHGLPGFRFGSERSYAYGALSGRPMLLEGWYEGGARNHPLFEKIKQANDFLFSTKDENAFWNVVRDFNIRFIVAKPNTDISLPAPRPNWLRELEDTGTLKIYKVME